MAISETSPVIDNGKQFSFRAFINLLLPLMLTLCATSLIGFCDRAFLIQSSMMDLGGYTSGFVLAGLFQMPLMRVTSLGQAFVSFYESANERHRVGESIWQMIWFSFFSMLSIVPVGYAIMPYVFGGSPVEAMATEYFTCILWGMFLIPLQTALTAFFVGKQETKTVFTVMFSAQCVHVLLDYVLIFGVGNYIPSLGALGAAIAFLVNRSISCLILLFLFLRPSQRKLYGTGRYFFNWKVFRTQMRAGLPLAIAPFISVSSWVAVSRIMTLKGEDHLMVFTIGCTLTASLAFISDSLIQAVMTSASSLLGKQNFRGVKRLIMHALFVVCLIMVLLAVPYLIYPKSLFPFLTSIPLTTPIIDLLLLTCYTSWFYLLCQGIQSIAMGLVFATRKTSIFIFTGSLQWVTGYLSVFVTIELWQWQATTFWMLTAANAVIISSILLWKAYQFLSPYKQELPG